VETIEIAERFNIPTKYDTAPFATIIKVVTGLGKDESHTFFIQTSTDEKTSHWMRIGDFLETAFKDLLADKAFIDETILRYKMARARENSVLNR